MLDRDQQQAIRSAVLNAFNVMRGSADTRFFRDHVLALLLLKYASDFAEGQQEQRGEAQRLTVTKDSSFYSLLNARNQPDIGQQIDHALRTLEAANPSLHTVFQEIGFNALAFGNDAQKTRVLSQLLTHFDVGPLDFRAANQNAADAVAFASETVISEIAATSGKQGWEFFTPPEISQLIARLMQPEPDESVCDPCCGSGTLLLTCDQVARELSGDQGCRLYGQEKSGSTWAMAKINMALHGRPDAELALGDTLRDPQLVQGGHLQTFDVVVSSPPFNLKDWGHEFAEHDPYGRYRRGLPPRGSADYAFISHMVGALTPTSGRMAVVVSLGALFRTGAEQKIREQLLQENLIDAVIALPAKLYPHTGIPVALIVLRKRPTSNVLFIDASRGFERGKTQNTLRESDLALIEGTYLARKDVEQYARVVPVQDIRANDSNLSVARYVDTTEEQDTVDIAQLRAERAQLTAELAEVEAKLAILLKDASHG